MSNVSFSFLNEFAKCYKILFLLCHYDVQSV